LWHSSLRIRISRRSRWKAILIARLFDPADVAVRENLMTRGWLRLQELAEKAQTVPLPEYPLPEFRTR
jgi:hypothetical protein